MKVHICSPHYYGNEVNQLSDITETPVSSGGGVFSIKGVSIKRSFLMKVCEIRIGVEIKYNSTLSDSKASGTISGYIEHTKWDKLGLIINPEKGAVLAHERGHAKKFVEYIPKLKEILSPYIGKTFVSNSKIQSAYDSFLDSASVSESIGKAANEATIQYFSKAGFTPLPPEEAERLLGFQNRLNHAWRKN